MLYPLKFKPLYKDYVWGGRNLTSLGKMLPAEGIVAESWEIACHKNGTSVIANGEFEGMPLPELIRRFGRKITGGALSPENVEKFPLLVKFIDAENNLSVQVHPDDDFAREHENGEYGKNEMWYIISAKPGAKLVYDVVPGTTREVFADAVKSDSIESCLKTVEVLPGDVINIPAGVVHAIGKGILLAEIQQNSDVTYRIYDYGRTGRELHIEKALKVIDFNTGSRKEKYRGLMLNPGKGVTKRIAVANRYFCTEIYDVDGTVAETADETRFYIYIFVSGCGSIICNAGISQNKAPCRSNAPCGAAAGKIISGSGAVDDDGRVGSVLGGSGSSNPVYGGIGGGTVCDSSAGDAGSCAGAGATPGEIPVKAGETVLIPAAMGKYMLSGRFTALKSYVPDLESDVIRPLLESGTTMNEILSEIGGLEAALKQRK